MLPVWVKAALAANDRLKVCLTLLQTAAAHAAHPKKDLPDLGQDLSAAGLTAPWLCGFAAAATRVDEQLVAPDMPRLSQCLADDLTLMARPVLQVPAPDAALRLRVKHWQDELGTMTTDRLADQQLETLTRGSRDGPDTLHLLVMDLHKQINKLSAALATEVIDGANVWDLQAEDRTRMQAFRRMP